MILHPIGVVPQGIRHIFLVIKRHSPYPELVGLLCAIGTIFCTYVLVKWNTIPVYDYYINAEYFGTDSAKKNLKTTVSLCVGLGGMLNSYSLHESETTENFSISVADTEPYETRASENAMTSTNLSNATTTNKIQNSYTKIDTIATSLVEQKLLYYTEGIFNDTINSLLNQVPFESRTPDRLFFVHLYARVEKEQAFIKPQTKMSYFSKDTLMFSFFKDGYCISLINNRNIDTIYHNVEWDTSFLSKEHRYCQFCGLKILNNNNTFTNRFEANLNEEDRYVNKLQVLMKMKDISRAYYKISFMSNTIQTYDLHIHFNQGVVLENMPRLCTFDVNAVEFPNVPTSYMHGEYDMKLYAAFPDGENAQTVRTFFMALVMTWLLKEFIRSLFRTFKKFTNQL